MPRNQRKLDLNKQARELLIDLMDRQGVTRKELAQRLDCSTEYVCQVLTGYSVMSLSTLERFAESLGVTLVITFEETIR